MDCVLAPKFRRREQTLDHHAAHQVRIDDLVDISQVHIAVPNAFGIDHRHRSGGAAADEATSTIPMKKNFISWMLCVLAAVLLFAWAGNWVRPNKGSSGISGDSGTALIAADFTLQSGDGKTVDAKALRGKYMLVYFGFTHCPDVCPTSLLLMSNAINQLEPAQKAKIQPIFITVDPERDTPKTSSIYASHFSKNFMGLSGTPAQIKHAADSFKVFYSKVEQKDSALGYVVDHSSFIYLMGPDGRYIMHFASTASEQELKKELMHYVR
jgi:cytochrome oxidase Cu insertion factor (SCO1/SenC/PrrC family)